MKRSIAAQRTGWVRFIGSAGFLFMEVKKLGGWDENSA
jgi:hypothetical protein